jgi:hypothetical protein
VNRLPQVVVCLVVALSGCTIAPDAQQPITGEGPDPSWTFVEFPASDFEDFRESTSSLQHWAGWIEGAYDSLVGPCPVPGHTSTLEHSLGALVDHIANSCLFDSRLASSLAKRAIHGGEWHLVDQWGERTERAYEDSIAAMSSVRLTSVADVEIAAVLMGQAIVNEALLENAREFRAGLSETSKADDVEILFLNYQAINRTATALVSLSRLFPIQVMMCIGPSGDVFGETRSGFNALLIEFSMDSKANNTGAYGALGGFIQHRLDRAEALGWWPYALDIHSRIPFYDAQLREASTAERLPSYDEAVALWWEAANTTPRSIWRDYLLEIIRPHEPPPGYALVEDRALWAMAAASLDKGWRFDDARCPAGL